MASIDLNNYIQKDEKVLSGRDYGGLVRQRSSLQKYDDENRKATINIPIDVTVNISFFLGLFGPSIRALGATKFRENYTFTCSKRCSDLIDRGIKQALKTSSVLVD